MCLLFIYLLTCTPTHLHKCNDLLAFIIKEKEKTNNNQNQKLTSEKFLIRGKQRKESEREDRERVNLQFYLFVQEHVFFISSCG